MHTKKPRQLSAKDARRVRSGMKVKTAIKAGEEIKFDYKAAWA
jgi:hypothetical protein